MSDTDSLAVAVMKTGDRASWDSFFDACEESGEWWKAVEIWWRVQNIQCIKYASLYIRCKIGEAEMPPIVGDDKASLEWGDYIAKNSGPSRDSFTMGIRRKGTESR